MTTYEILVVDDGRSNRKSLRAALRQKSLRVRRVANAKKAWRAVEKRLPDLVLCDYHGARADGIDLVAALKQDLRTQDVPVLLVTELDPIDSAVHGFEAGADDTLALPLAADDIRRRLIRHLEHRVLAPVGSRPGPRPAKKAPQTAAKAVRPARQGRGRQRQRHSHSRKAGRQAVSSS